jgi:A/G-specific adenine glycosylase
MDIGARLCLPRGPRCNVCPLAGACRFAGGGTAPPALARSRASVRPATPFASTSRWLRGRIVDRLRDAPDGAWVRFDRPIGDHPPRAVAVEIDRLASEGLLERRPGGRVAARLAP